LPKSLAGWPNNSIVLRALAETNEYIREESGAFIEKRKADFRG